ncbi:Txe/YoeB family addiction module toxin [Calothrix sp. UHCC 0171]|uniref:Txe/YoeB family addiction module toxin n=1 Tax=Calothrix sp. UHCC 0171 TaxID=3110245 RepID=UPI002B1F0F95|nr:Txe/YoeB family addiction module toxin [Calothrix sp. UHCC 0171]MEA5572655.1 Txe/YoeB family addiction module toxin [Calothrix sp. UHCC 0171]
MFRGFGVVSQEGIEDFSYEQITNSEVVTWKLVYTKQTQKDAKKLASSNLKEKAEELLAVIAKNPFQNPPPYEKLVGDLSGAYSRRINIQHRLVYEVIESEQKVKVIRMWTHYE